VAAPAPERVPLAQLPTPVEPMDRLAEWLGGPRLLVKRDDLTGLALGGNKARKLEFLCAEAIAAGCDVLVTGGGPQSNHVRMTTAAANRLGLECHIALSSDEPEVATGNLLLDRVLGAQLHFVGSQVYYGTESAIESVAADLARAGRRPFAIPVGGASVTGVRAYVRAVDELLGQLDGETVDWMVVADGSGGTHAGILAGVGDGATRVLGVDVGTRPDLDEKVPELAVAAAAVEGRAAPGETFVDHENYGEDYGAVTDSMIEAVRVTASLEGIVLDPVYSGKAMAGLVAAVRDGRITAGETVVFWHTGGAPALFAERYAAVFS
jgi:D-cysteine desulfhydrase family pyridoxal phosphate-dependent enzyme